MARCEDCGTPMNGGICSNCHEELYIMTYQADDMDAVSQEFRDLADEQRQAIKRRASEGGTGR
jgi:hypothetical protein